MFREFNGVRIKSIIKLVGFCFTGTIFMSSCQITNQSEIHPSVEVSSTSGIDGDKYEDDKIEIIIPPNAALVMGVSDVKNDLIDSIEKNDDESYSILVSKDNQKILLNNISSTINDGLEGMINEEAYTFTSIEANDSFSNFKVTMSGDNLNLSEHFTPTWFYIYGGMFNYFSGNSIDNIHIDYVKKDGSIVSTADSGDLETFYKELIESQNNNSSSQELSSDSIEVINEYLIKSDSGILTYHLCVVKNNTDEAIDINSNATGYDEGGNLITAADGDLSALPAGQIGLFHEDFYTDKTIVKVESSYKIKRTGHTVVMDKFDVKTTDTGSGVILQVTNNGDIEADNVRYTVLFLKGGEVVGFQESLITLETLKPGETASKQFDAGKKYDSYEVFNTAGYGAIW